ncbi:fumarylacetoacetate hydrolase family protein [Mucilaginibacter achroorhodeus]|uniref:Fumarylacetoacetate hydrolase family protein n=1 Tax=Mucilaginibacter achroorhodeus TaxID=2599294 RepID=A0A563U054_9SPHI|nr:fumarylacetoacetate hydrolase family protein [Mucilaginibacter achroorhodeus]TWR24913.1 fumarylacetoacetate hydrolase family protein [Mucilaginibacter achroorhodeus]
MKLIRYGEAGKEKTGIILNDKKYDTSGFGEDYNEQFFETDGLARLQKYVEENKSGLQEIAENERLGSPIARPSKIICIGLNYKDHAEETNAPLPKEPIIFFKSTTALVGPDDDIIIPKNSVKTDWEVELAVVVGKKASYVEENEALEYVAGYVLHNDVSEREFQLERNGTWDKGKGCDTFAPIGPFMATTEEIEEVHNLKLWLKVNDKMMQNGTTANLIFNIPFLVSYVSQFMTLLPGDIISTGTPAGVGLGFNPPVYLKAGDVVELGIDGLGTAKQVVKAYAKN